MAHTEVRKKRLTAQVLQPKVLLAPELPSQCGLPITGFELWRAARARQAGGQRLGRLGFFWAWVWV
jgi:hypothetical protein